MSSRHGTDQLIQRDILPAFQSRQLGISFLEDRMHALGYPIHQSTLSRGLNGDGRLFVNAWRDYLFRVIITTHCDLSDLEDQRIQEACRALRQEYPTSEQIGKLREIRRFAEVARDQSDKWLSMFLEVAGFGKVLDVDFSLSAESVPETLARILGKAKTIVQSVLQRKAQNEQD